MSVSYFGDYNTTETVIIPFNTFDSNDPTASVTITNLVAGDVEIHKDGGLTQRSSDAGVTVTIDFDSVTGNHIVSIDLSDDTDTGFYEAGSRYQVRIEGTTVDGGTINGWIGSFSIGCSLRPSVDGRELVISTSGVANSNVKLISDDANAADNLELMYDGTGYVDDTAPSSRAQLDSLQTGAAGISTTADNYLLTTGTQSSGTIADTYALDGVTHQHTDAAGTMDLYYEFQIGSGSPAEVLVNEGLIGNNDDLNVYGYDWIAADWVQIGNLDGTVAGTINEAVYQLTVSMVGTGTDLGKVRIRYFNTGLTSATLFIDRIWLAFNQGAGGYVDGIEVDTDANNTNTVPGVDGVKGNPVSTWAAAISLSTQTNIQDFKIANGSSIVLSSDSTKYTLLGRNWSLDLNGQTITNAVFEGCETIGTGLGTNYEFSVCKLGNGTGVSLNAGFFSGCILSGDLTITGTGDYYLLDCKSGVAGSSTPSIDFGAAIGNTNVNFRNYSGGIELQNMGQSGTDNMSLEGNGQYIVNANCISGDLQVRGSFKKTDNSAGLVTINEEANIKTDTIHDGYVRASTVNSIQLATAASSTDGAYDPARIFIVKGTGAGQTRDILEYLGSTRMAYVDRNWKVNPDTTSEYRIISWSGREHINEGLTQAGSGTSVTLNSLASASDDAYNNQLIFIRSGTGEDQVRLITDYNGTTKVATVNRAWDVNPNATSGYVILPTSIYTEAQITALIEGATLSVSLEDDSITASKFDETTAFPLRSDDAGNTEVARTGADGDTLETLSDQVDLQATLAEQAKIPKSDGSITWNATALASIEAEAFDALDLQITSGGAPTAGSMLDYMRRAKFGICNRWVIDETTGDLEIFDDNNVSFATITGAFTSLAGDTTRRKLL